MTPDVKDLTFIVVGVAAVAMTVRLQADPVSSPPVPVVEVAPAPLTPLPDAALDLGLRFRGLQQPVVTAAGPEHAFSCHTGFDMVVRALRITRFTVHDERRVDSLELDVQPLAIASGPDSRNACNGGTGRWSAAQLRILAVDIDSGFVSACRAVDARLGPGQLLRCALPAGAQHLRFNVVDDTLDEHLLAAFVVDVAAGSVVVENAGPPAIERVADVLDRRQAWEQRAP